MVNVVVRDAILAALHDEHAYRWRINQAAVVNMIVGDHIALVLFEWLQTLGCFTNSNPARAEIEHFVAEDSVSLAAFAQFERIAGKSRESALVDQAIHGPLGEYITATRHRCLSIGVTIRWQRPVRICES